MLLLPYDPMMHSYFIVLDSFIETAKEYYNRNDLNLNTIIRLFDSYIELQKDLDEYNGLKKSL